MNNKNIFIKPIMGNVNKNEVNFVMYSSELIKFKIVYGIIIIGDIDD